MSSTPSEQVCSVILGMRTFFQGFALFGFLPLKPSHSCYCFAHNKCSAAPLKLLREEKNVGSNFCIKNCKTLQSLEQIQGPDHVQVNSKRKFSVRNKAYWLIQCFNKSETSWFPIDLRMIRSQIYEFLKIFTTFWNQKKPEFLQGLENSGLWFTEFMRPIFLPLPYIVCVDRNQTCFVNTLTIQK